MGCASHISENSAGRDISVPFMKPKDAGVNERWRIMNAQQSVGRWLLCRASDV
jgi:hypothetical protein